MTLIRLALATWRLVSLLQDEDGPYLVFERLRRALGPTRTRQQSGRDWFESPTHGLRAEIARVVECRWCLSVWVGFFVAIADRRASPLIDGLAASAAYLLADQAVGTVGSSHGQSTNPDVAAA